MAVKRIVPNIAANRVEDAKAFYSGILGLELVMDHGWVLTFAAGRPAPPQISIATEGGVVRYSNFQPPMSLKGQNRKSSG